MLFSVLFACFFLKIGEIKCDSLFHNPIHEIATAKQECYNTEPQNIWSCALDKSKLLTASGDAIKPSEFGPWFTPFAIECFTYSARPSNKEAEQFAKCLFNASVKATLEKHENCLQFVMDNLPENATWPIEPIETVQDFDCYVYCMLSKSNYIADNDELDINAINPRLPEAFNLEETVVRCEMENESEDKCQKLANSYLCMSKTLTGIVNYYDEFKYDYVEFI